MVHTPRIRAAADCACLSQAAKEAETSTERQRLLEKVRVAEEKERIALQVPATHSAWARGARANLLHGMRMGPHGCVCVCACVCMHACVCVCVCVCVCARTRAHLFTTGQKMEVLEETLHLHRKRVTKLYKKVDMQQKDLNDAKDAYQSSQDRILELKTALQVVDTRCFCESECLRTRVRACVHVSGRGRMRRTVMSKPAYVKTRSNRVAAFCLSARTHVAPLK